MTVEDTEQAWSIRDYVLGNTADVGTLGDGGPLSPTCPSGCVCFLYWPFEQSGWQCSLTILESHNTPIQGLCTAFYTTTDRTRQ